ncbi:hypothetical protein BaRGS_00039005 [Batillaria attramentaria]|uniref:Aspartyl/asparaginy/proline hydroxylase domain-containing protein n=1 Tax=Batillaria attramentaria TaxID=370345 RepID=A0ABD0J496_9CAEN
MGDEYIITLCIGFVIFVVIVKFLSHYYYYSAPLPTDINLKRLFGSASQRCATSYQKLIARENPDSLDDDFSDQHPIVLHGSNTSALEKCPVTWKAIQSLPCAMTGNLFSNVAFSVVMPGTTVLPHYGPTNIRLRAHLGLQVPAECHMVVNNTRVEWKEGQIVCFDETFLHHVKHEGTPESLPRVILIVDLWHPNLTVEQQKMIDYAFSPEGTVLTAEKGTVVNEVK